VIICDNVCHATPDVVCVVKVGWGGVRRLAEALPEDPATSLLTLVIRNKAERLGNTRSIGYFFISLVSDWD
jgi:hypothetical protein